MLTIKNDIETSPPSCQNGTLGAGLCVRCEYLPSSISNRLSPSPVEVGGETAVCV